MEWESWVREKFDYIPERSLSSEARRNLLNCFLSNPDYSIKFLQVHITSGIVDIVCPNKEALDQVKLKIRWFVSNNTFYNFFVWGKELTQISEFQAAADPEIRHVALFPVETFRIKDTYRFLKHLRDVDAVDNVYTKYSEDDQFVSIMVKSSSDEAANECSLRIQDFLKTQRSLNPPFTTKPPRSSVLPDELETVNLPVPCGSKAFIADSGLLDSLFDEFKGINSLEYDESENSLKISVISEAKKLVIFRVLGLLSLNKKAPGIRRYRVFLNRLYKDINVCPVTGEATIFLSDTSISSLRVDFKDCIYDKIKIFWSNLPEASYSARVTESKFNFYAFRNNICGDLRGRIDKGFVLFLDWDILPSLSNIEVSIRLGGVSMSTNKVGPGMVVEDHVAKFSRDLKLPHEVLIKILTDRDFKINDCSSFASLSFFDLSSNARYSATFPISPSEAGDKEICITKRRAKHVNNILIKSGCTITYRNIISSDIALPPGKLEVLKDFAQVAFHQTSTNSDDLHYDNFFSLFNASNVKRYTLINDKFKVEIDVTSKKTLLRNCKSENVTRFTVTYPHLCNNIKQLQNCSESEIKSLKQTLRLQHEELIDFADEISEIVDLETL